MTRITTKQICANIREEIKRIDTLQNLDDFTESEEYREPLSLDVTIEVKILLSCGGPGDGFKLRFSNGELLGGVYYMADWGEYKEENLLSDEAQKVYDFYLSGDIESFMEAQKWKH